MIQFVSHVSPPSTVDREGLFPMCGGRGDRRPNEDDSDRPAFEGIVCIELTSVAVDPANLGVSQRAAATARPIKRPLIATGVEEAQRQPRDALARRIEFVEVAHAAKDWPGLGDRFELVPLRAA